MPFLYPVISDGKTESNTVTLHKKLVAKSNLEPQFPVIPPLSFVPWGILSPKIWFPREPLP